MPNSRINGIVAGVVAAASLVGVTLVLDRHFNAPTAMAPRGDQEVRRPQGPLWHCGMHPQVVQNHPGDCPICHMALTPFGDTGSKATGMERAPAHAEPAGPSVTIDPAVVQNMGVRTATVDRGPLGRTVRAVGILHIPDTGFHDVALKVGGWVDKLYVDQEGAHVHEGDVLFDFYSPDLRVAEQELIGAVRGELALPADAGPDVRRESQAMVESAKRKLRLWDVAERDIDAVAKAEVPPKTVPFRSPATGHIEDKAVVQGSAVQPMTKLMRVADHSKMWLDAQVYQDQIAAVSTGQRVTAAVDGTSGHKFIGEITFIAPHLDHMTRTLTVRITLDNPDFDLRPGMYGTVQIATGPVPDAIVIPREAVIDTGLRQIVFVVDGPGHFTPREIRVGVTGDDDKVQVLDGLSPGETVVTSGQFLMDVESRTIEATKNLIGPTAADAGSAPPTTESVSPAKASADTTEVSVAQLSVAYCPMKKASWIQNGDGIDNPYFGRTMPTCGSIRRKLFMPSPGSPLRPLIRPYLDVAKGFTHDQVDGAAITALRTAADLLPADAYGDLKQVSMTLALAGDVAAARAAFQTFSDRLITALTSDGR